MSTVAEDLKNGVKSRKDIFKEDARLRREVKRELDAEEYRLVGDPDIATLRERLKRPRPEVQYRIAQLQAVGHRVLLAAQFKAGKTTVAANLARSVLDGTAFLGAYTTTAITGSLALLDFEMSPTQLDEWYEAQRIVNDDRLVVVPMRGLASAFNILEPSVRQQWVERLKSRRVHYLILDCLRPVLDALGLNEHSEAGLFLTALDALLREADIPEALVIQHMGHNAERARGDSRLLDWPDVGWTLVRQKEDDPAAPRFFKAYGRDVDVPETQLSYDPTTRRLTVVRNDDGKGVSRADAKLESAAKAICAFLATVDTPQSRAGIEQAVMSHGHTRDSVRKALAKAVDTRAVITEEGGQGGGFKYRSAFSVRPDFMPFGEVRQSAEVRQSPPAE